MKRTLLQRLLEARAGKLPAAHLRWLEQGEEALVVAGEVVDGPPLPPSVLETIRTAHRRDKGVTIPSDAGPLFIQVFNPPLRLIVVGAVHIAQVLVPMASLTGYDVTVVDPRRSFASDARFPGVDVRTDWPDEALDFFEHMDMAFDSRGRPFGYWSLAAILLALLFALAAESPLPRALSWGSPQRTLNTARW